MSIRCGTADVSHEVKDFEGCTFTGCFRFIDSEHVQVTDINCSFIYSSH